MNNRPNRKRGIRRETASPFGGLGFDLACVREAARSMTVRVTPLPKGSATIRPDASRPVVRPHGFALLTVLGREIRGR